MTYKEKWKNKLTAEQCCVVREGDTGVPFSGEYVMNKTVGICCPT